MNKILISINPEHAENILEGLKKYEYRTKVAKKDINKMLVYSTCPTMKVVAEFEIIEVLSMAPDELWNLTKEQGCITKEFFDKYFKDRNIACAYKLGKVKKFDIPRELKDFGIKAAPKSFVYL